MREHRWVRRQSWVVRTKTLEHDSLLTCGGTTPGARCPRFASVFWTLTLAGDRPTEHFQLTISGRLPHPSRFCLGGRNHYRFACARPRSHAPVTGFTDNGAPIRTLVARGFVSLCPDEGRTAAGQPVIFEKQLPVAGRQFLSEADREKGNH